MERNGFGRSPCKKSRAGGDRFASMPSIVIPAHDEERVLAETLERALEGLGADVEVLVVCNGCTDRTAAVAMSFAPRVAVIEIATASKVAALNEGDARARAFPRVYLDADIPISGADLARVIAAVGRPGALAAEPRARFDFTRVHFLVRAYYAVWLGLHGTEPGDVGCGLYALSAAGRARFGPFPPVIADDGYVRAHFAPGEIELVADAEAMVRVARTLGDLVRVMTRSKLGVVELASRFPELWDGKRARGASLASKLKALPLRLWPLLPIYVVIQGWVAVRVRLRASDLPAYRWERDRSRR